MRRCRGKRRCVSPLASDRHTIALVAGRDVVKTVRGAIRAQGRPLGAVPISLARDLRRRATAQERKVWGQLKLLRPLGLHFRRQVPIGAFVVDFACLRRRVVVELDGGQHARDADAARDARRDAELAAMGFQVRRFWNAEVDGNLNGVIETILAAAGCSTYVDESHVPSGVPGRVALD